LNLRILHSSIIPALRAPPSATPSLKPQSPLEGGLHPHPHPHLTLRLIVSFKKAYALHRF
jgi:hypothetical protein